MAVPAGATTCTVVVCIGVGGAAGALAMGSSAPGWAIAVDARAQTVARQARATLFMNPYVQVPLVAMARVHAGYIGSSREFHGRPSRFASLVTVTRARGHGLAGLAQEVAAECRGRRAVARAVDEALEERAARAVTTP